MANSPRCYSRMSITDNRINENVNLFAKLVISTLKISVFNIGINKNIIFNLMLVV